MKRYIPSQALQDHLDWLENRPQAWLKFSELGFGLLALAAAAVCTL